MDPGTELETSKEPSSLAFSAIFLIYPKPIYQGMVLDSMGHALVSS